MRDVHERSSHSQKRKNPIRHIAVDNESSGLFATADFEQSVTLWSYKQRSALTRLHTVLDFGGKRLAIDGHQQGLVAAAAYPGPIELFSGLGSTLWNRADLKMVQQLAFVSLENSVLLGVGADEQPYRLIAADDGREVARIPEVAVVVPNFFSKQLLCVTRRNSIVLIDDRLTTLCERPLVSFGVLHAAFSPADFAYAEAAGSIYCTDYRGTQRWCVAPEEGHHFLRLVWNSETCIWLAIAWDYEHGGEKQLFSISDVGKCEHVGVLGDSAELEFAAGGKHLITSDGDVLDSSSLKSVWRFLAPSAGD